MSAPDDEIAQLQRQVWEASNRRDVAALQGLLDDDFVLVEADALERKGKDDFLRDVAERGDDETLLAFSLDQVKVHHAGDMAVAYAQFHCEDEIDGERVRMDGNTIDVFVRRGGGWRLVGSVYGEVPPFQE